ncbi:MAG: TolC family protein [Candidatus Latescibacterota bacterium]|nr:TolC family protein [Candidatus Latescibacterota bacterium]
MGFGHTFFAISVRLLGCCIFFTLFVNDAYSAKFSLAKLVELAVANNPQLKAAGADVAIAEALSGQARAARVLPKFDLTFAAGPSPEARGNALIGDTDLSSFNVFTRTEATFIQPLFTFGRLAAAQEAAKQGVEARTEGLLDARAKLELQVTQAYYGLLLANHLWDLATEARTEIGKARDLIAEKLQEEEGDYTYTDLFRLDRFVYDVEENANKVAKGRRLLESLIRKMGGLAPEARVELAEAFLTPVDIKVESLESYVERAVDRHDLKQLRAGIRVKDAQVKAIRSEYYPQFFIGGQLKFAHAPNRDDQNSPFANDDFNFLQAGAIIGFKQSLAFGMTATKLRKVELERKKLTYLDQLASMGAVIEIERIHGDLVEAKSNVDAAKKARRGTRKWFLAARDGFNAGLEDAGEIIDAIKEYSFIRAKYFSAVYEFNKAHGALQRATGGVVVDLVAP